MTPTLPLTAFVLLVSFAVCHGVEVVVARAVTAVQRPGITGAGFAVAAADGKRVTLHYPNHPDDFGGSAGTGTANSDDAGATWSAGADDWPLPKAVDLWQDRMRDGSFAALGIHWLPDPKLRGQLGAQDVPASPWRIALSQDGRQWSSSDVAVKIPADFGVVARPLPHIMEADNGSWLMPAYAWGKTGNRTLLLKSEDRGRNWTVHSTIATGAAMLRSGVQVTMPWLETMVTRTKDCELLAVMRTGSSAESSLVSSRSSDGGAMWSMPEKVVCGQNREAVTGKLPNVFLLPNGMLALLSAHTKRGCRLYLSLDGTGRTWSEGHVITTVTGGNTSMVSLDAAHLLVFTPENGRINCWQVTLRP